MILIAVTSFLIASVESRNFGNLNTTVITNISLTCFLIWSLFLMQVGLALCALILFFSFNWRIMALQCWIGFSYTTTQISHKYICNPSLLRLPRPTPLGHHRAPGWAPCVTEQLPAGYLFNTWWCIYWRRKWQPTPVFLPGESQGWWSLVGCRLWGCTESDTTEAT